MTTDATYDPAARRDTPLALKLKAHIRQHGPMTLAQYMTACLQDDEHGYYRRQRAIGVTGDFITAPEISQVFGELIGLWCAIVWQQMGAPSAFNLIELGPGRGTMMADMLRAVKIVPGFLPAARIKLIEASPTLRSVQQARLAQTGVDISWHADVPFEPGPTIIIANEFLDVFPIEQWRVVTHSQPPVSAERDATRWEQCHVEVDGQGRLAFTWLPVQQTSDDRCTGPALGGRVPAPAEQFKPGAIIEKRVNACCDVFASEFQPSIHDQFAALAIDYGHVETTEGDTLQAVRDHRPEHPLTSPGEADLTAQVDFQEFAGEVLEQAFLNDTLGKIAVDGPTTQAEFLGRLGIMERASRLIAANPTRANEIETGVARLMSPIGMGTRFKAIGIRSRSLPPLPGF